MSTLSPDAKAVVAALDAVSTQARRIADALTTPVVEHEVRADDDATTPATTCSAQYHGPHHPKTACIRAAQHEHPRHSNGEGFHWPDSAAVYPVHDGPVRVAPAADEAAPNMVRVLADRAARGVISEAEGAALRHRVEQLLNGRATWKAKAEEIERDRDRVAEDRDAADRIRAEVQRDRDQHAAVLAEVLRQFTHETHPGRRCLQSGHVPVETVERWRSVVALTVERPWWQQVAEARAELEQAQAAIERVRRECASMERDMYGAEDDGMRVAIVRVLAALDGTEQPADPEALHAKLDEATATLRRLRAVAKSWEQQALPHSQAHRLLTEVREALAGPHPDDDPPTTQQNRGGCCDCPHEMEA